MDQWNALAPTSPISYLELVQTVLSNFRDLHSHAELAASLGRGRVTDITDNPDTQTMMAMKGDLPEGFEERQFAFRESETRGGFCDVAFCHADLVNFKAQMFFNEWFGSFRAGRYIKKQLLPLVLRHVGAGTFLEGHRQMFLAAGQDRRVYLHRGLVVSVGRIPGVNFVSTYVTDDRYD